MLRVARVWLVVMLARQRLVQDRGGHILPHMRGAAGRAGTAHELDGTEIVSHSHIAPGRRWWQPLSTKRCEKTERGREAKRESARGKRNGVRLWLCEDGG